MVIGPYGRHGGLGESFGNSIDGRKRKFDSAACGPMWSSAPTDGTVVLSGSCRGRPPGRPMCRLWEDFRKFGGPPWAAARTALIASLP